MNKLIGIKFSPNAKKYYSYYISERIYKDLEQKYQIFEIAHSPNMAKPISAFVEEDGCLKSIFIDRGSFDYDNLNCPSGIKMKTITMVVFPRFQNTSCFVRVSNLTAQFIVNALIGKRKNYSNFKDTFEGMKGTSLGASFYRKMNTLTFLSKELKIPLREMSIILINDDLSNDSGNFDKSSYVQITTGSYDNFDTIEGIATPYLNSSNHIKVRSLQNERVFKGLSVFPSFFVTDINYTFNAGIYTNLDKNYTYAFGPDDEDFPSTISIGKDNYRVNNVVRGKSKWGCTCYYSTSHIPQTLMKIQNTNTNKKENIFMTKFGFKFGKVDNRNLAYSIKGPAFYDGKQWVTYSDNDLIDVTDFILKDFSYFYYVPVALNAVQVGDIIYEADRVGFVTEVNDHTYKIMDPVEHTITEILPKKNLFNFHYVTKIVNLLGDNFSIGADASADQPFGNLTNLLPLMMLQDSDSSSDKLLPLMLMQQGGISGGEINPLMMYMMMKDSGDGSNSLLPLLMLQNGNSIFPIASKEKSE